MRGGLDDALDRLARRDELRRRASGETPGTPPAVTELVEAIAAVVGRNPQLGVTVGVEGAGPPTLLHFAVEDGVVQVSADNNVPQQRVAETRHEAFIDVEESNTPPHGYVFPQQEQPPQQQFHYAAQPGPPPQPGPADRGMPPPLAEPIPLHIDEKETEAAAKRLSALLREDPGLLRSQE